MQYLERKARNTILIWSVYASGTGHEDAIVYDVDENTKSACWSPKRKRRHYMHRVGAITTYAINTGRTVLFLNIHYTQHTQEIPDIRYRLHEKIPDVRYL